ncbi:InlB B-repeat-containing protein [Candidatus Bathycorpusculum sp.]|uniref:InlB B-repeat-containing protein n=1 Tax=Candidatus Bathycorpusculum sp. TaxID=2994959 RepID=UPI00282A38CC|nr:InlB B-repeat-containing protein [Candidatus Termitimicrobium sp.]MCL2432355.1 InlB B-repeat-containing protein [Candidatus Termitimicrobium sp.]
MDVKTQKNLISIIIVFAFVVGCFVAMPQTDAVAVIGQIIYLEGSGNSFAESDWHNTFTMTGDYSETLTPTAWHLTYTGNNFDAVTHMRITFTNGVAFVWYADNGPSLNNDGNNPSWVIVAPADWEIVKSASFIATTEQSNNNIAFNIAGFQKGTSNTVEPLTYTVTFDINGGDDGTMTDMDVQFGEEITLIPNAFTKADITEYRSNGYTKFGSSFIGWSTTADGEVEYENTQTFIHNQACDLTLYAVWDAETLLDVDATGVGLSQTVSITLTVTDHGVTTTETYSIPKGNKPGEIQNSSTVFSTVTAGSHIIEVRAQGNNTPAVFNSVLPA